MILKRRRVRRRWHFGMKSTSIGETLTVQAEVEMSLAFDMAQLGLLLLVAAIAAMVSRRLGLPYTVGLVLAGIGMAALPVHFDLQLSKELIFSVLLPPLVFEASLAMHWPELKADLPVVTTLATVGIVLAAAVTAAGMHVFAAWDWSAAILFGALISATDPVSVIATFREAKVKGRLSLLVESESVLNDGTAAIAFVVALAAITGGVVSPVGIAQSLVLSIGGGVACGLLVGFVAMFLAGRSTDHLVEITFTTLAAYGSFQLAEYFHFSGILASMAAGLLVGTWRSKGAFSKLGEETLESFWEYVAFLANSVIFILIGVRESQQNFADGWKVALIAVAVVLAGRAAAIYPICALFRLGRRPVTMAHQHVLFWGGLRGALALALALGLPQSMPQRETIINVAFAVVAFSIFVQGLTMNPLLRKLGQLRG
jgi:monovalent cation:H+ antiporter, CPA1 family